MRGLSQLAPVSAQDLAIWPLDLWMLKEDRARLTAVELNLRHGALAPRAGRRRCSLVIQSRVRDKESAQEIGSLATRYYAFFNNLNHPTNVCFE